jgi:hypothetical protein
MIHCMSIPSRIYSSGNKCQCITIDRTRIERIINNKSNREIPSTQSCAIASKRHGLLFELANYSSKSLCQSSCEDIRRLDSIAMWHTNGLSLLSRHAHALLVENELRSASVGCTNLCTYHSRCTWHVSVGNIRLHLSCLLDDIGRSIGRHEIRLSTFIVSFATALHEHGSCIT